MNAISSIRQWCASNGYSFVYGNPMHVNEWMNGTDFAASTGGTAVYCHLLTASDYDGSRDTYNVGIYFATLIPFDFDNNTIDATTEALKERAKTLLADLQAGNELSWSGARFQYGYDDYAENVCWCCLRVTLTALAADCVEMPTPTVEVVSVPSMMAEIFADQFGFTTTTHDDIVSGTEGTHIVFGSSVLSESDLSNYTATIIVNGTELEVMSQTALIDSDIVSEYPTLAGYEGKYITASFSSEGVVYQSGEYNVVISIGDVWTATATWEEV